MKILVVSNTIPHQEGGGGSIRVINLLRVLAQHATVSFLPIPQDGYTDQQIQQFKHNCPEVQFIGDPGVKNWHAPRSKRQALHQRIIKRVLHSFSSEAPYRAMWSAVYLEKISAVLAATLKQDCYDLIQIEHVELASWLPCFPGNHVFALDCQDIVSTQLWTFLQVEKAWLKRFEILVEWRKFRRFEQRWAKQFDICLVMSQNEGQRLHEVQPRAQVSIVPNGVDTAYFYPSANKPAENRLVFTGSMSHLPNADAMLRFCRDILPAIRAQIPAVTLDIVGHSPTPAVKALAASYPGVRVVGQVPDTRPYIWDASLYIAPIRAGGGTRLKILEALACGKAVVATPFACNGLGLEDGRHLILRETAEDFAAAVIDLLQNPAKADQLGATGRGFVVKNYDWASIGMRLFTTYDRISREKVKAV